MKRILFVFIIISSLVFKTNAQNYQPEWKSLQNCTVPEWYEDAKLGFWVHWGVYSVPAFKGDHAAEWYGRWMYSHEGQSSRNNQGLATYLHHKEKYGDPATFGYKDFIPMFKAEKFDADNWADLCIEGGAKFFTMMAAHHDSFCLWNTKFSKWNSVNMGPKRDLVGEMATAARKKGLKYGVSNHTAWNYTFFQWNHINGYDAKNKEYQDLYGNPIVQVGADTICIKKGEDRSAWLNRSRGAVKPSKRDLDRWLERTNELVDLYSPDLYYFDWGMNPEVFESRRKLFASHYYNKSIEDGKGKYGNPNVVLNYKGFKTFAPGAAVRDHERGGEDDIAERTWQTDDCVYDGNNWGYAENIPIKPVNRIVDELMDIISKRGVLMLSFAPKADGTFPKDQQKFIRELGSWLKVCGEAVYSTRPWVRASENILDKNDDTIKVCFTRSKNSKKLFATLLEMPKTPILISSINTDKFDVSNIASISLIGADEKIKWSMDKKGILLDLSNVKPKQNFAFPIKIEFK